VLGMVSGHSMLLQMRSGFFCVNELVKHLNGFSSHALIGVDVMNAMKEM